MIPFLTMRRCGVDMRFRYSGSTYRVTYCEEWADGVFFVEADMEEMGVSDLSGLTDRIEWLIDEPQQA